MKLEKFQLTLTPSEWNGDTSKMLGEITMTVNGGREIDSRWSFERSFLETNFAYILKEAEKYLEFHPETELSKTPTNN